MGIGAVLAGGWALMAGYLEAKKAMSGGPGDLARQLQAQLEGAGYMDPLPDAEPDEATSATGQPSAIPRNIGHDIDVMNLLAAAGVSQEGIAIVTSTPSMVDLVKRNPTLAIALAQRYPRSGVVSSYKRFADESGFGPDVEFRFSGSGGADAMAFNVQQTGQTTSAVGAIRYGNGVIVNPATGQIAFPNDPKVAGSGLWLANVSNWSEEKIGRWRKRLHELGYIATPKRGVTPDLVTGLQEFHANRYLYGGGKPVPAEDAATEISRADFGGLLDRSVLQGEVRGWFAEAFGDDPSDDEMDFWTRKLAHVSMRVARRKGYEPATAAAVAGSRIEQQFYDSPQAQEVMDNEIENTSLRDDLIEAARASDFLAFGR